MVALREFWKPCVLDSQQCMPFLAEEVVYYTLNTVNGPTSIECPKKEGILCYSDEHGNTLRYHYRSFYRGNYFHVKPQFLSK